MVGRLIDLEQIAARRLPVRVIRDVVAPPASPAMSAMPPKREVLTALGCGRNRLHADAAIGVSYRDATGMTLTAETVTIARPHVVRAAVSRRRSAKPATVSTSALAQHLDCSRTYIVKLEAEGVLHRAPDGSGFDVDASRVAYLRYLRRERRQSPRSEADADFQRAKSELIRLRIAEKQRHLIPLVEAVGHMEEMVGLFLSRLSGFAARCGGRDLAARRAIDQAVYDLRLEISQAATKLADQRGEAPLDDDA
jgi:hypothetical protein